MASGKILLVGAGSIGRALLSQLDEDIPLICIDRQQKNLDRALELRPTGLTTVCGDATSRLQLEDLGLDDINTVIISSTSERINIEVTRVIKEHFDVPQVISVGITEQGIIALQELDAEVEDLFYLCARGIVNQLGSKTRTATGIGLEKNEILQVEVHPDSRLVNKKLSAFHPSNWRIGIIYRNDTIIVPRGSVVLKPHDKVILLGDPRAINTMAERLTFKFTDFPLEFGDTLIVLLPRKFDQTQLDETCYLCNLLPIEKLLVVAGSEDWRQPLQELATANKLKWFKLAIAEGREGLSVLPELVAEHKVRPALLVCGRKQVLRAGIPLLQAQQNKRALEKSAADLACPLLLTAGTFPYHKISIPSLSPLSLERALEASLELSPLAKATLEVLAVEPSNYLGTEEDHETADSMEKIVTYLARSYKQDIPEKFTSGNPIHALLAGLSESQLLVCDIDGWKKSNLISAFLSPDVAWEVVRRAPLSCLLLPPGEVFE